MARHEHRWERYVLRFNKWDGMRFGEIYYIGYRCRCGEIGYAV